MKTKRKYITPEIETFFVEIEGSIAAASETISIHTPGAEYEPEVEDWETGFDGNTNHEF